MTPLPGLSVRLYQVFAQAEGRWATPHWWMGVDLAPRAYKPMQIEWKPSKMIPTQQLDGGSHDE